MTTTHEHPAHPAGTQAGTSPQSTPGLHQFPRVVMIARHLPRRLNLLVAGAFYSGGIQWT